MRPFLTGQCNITKVAAAATAATSAVTSSAIDMQGYDNVLVFVEFGTPAADNVIKLQQCDTSGGTYADLEGTSVSVHASGSAVVAVEVRNPLERYIKAVALRGTSSTTLTMYAIQYNAQAAGAAPTATTSLAIEAHQTPAEGTA